jgi:hypothetical protein
MTITLTNGSTVTTLCAGDARSSTGDPEGPRDLRMQIAPGAAVREYVGADRVEPEHVRCDSGSVSFGATRTFATEALALAYIATTIHGEASEGQLKFDSTNVFGAKSVVTQRVAALVGRTVHVNYTIQG